MPFFILMAPKVSKVAFYSKVTYFKIAQKVSKYLGHFNEKICCYNFRTSPNLVTLGPILFLGKLAVQSRVRILRWGGGKGNVREVPKVFSHVVVVVVCAFITDVVSREEKREGERERESDDNRCLETNTLMVESEQRTHQKINLRFNSTLSSYQVQLRSRPSSSSWSPAKPYWLA